MAQPLDEAIQALLRQAGGNIITPTAYDTAWVAAVPTQDGTRPRFAQSLAWLRAHQHPDGSWGSPWPYYHDRLLSTLRAVLTLHQWRAAEDQAAIAEGLEYIRRYATYWEQDPWETVGFELIFPTLLAEAEAQGLDLPYAVFAPIQRLGSLKRARTPLHLAYDRRVSLSFSLEALGGAFDRTRAAVVQEANGSVATSPAATAFLLQQAADNAPAAEYLAQVLRAGAGDGGIPAFFPTELFEQSWTLYLLGHADPHLYQGREATITPLLDGLRAVAEPAGWTTSASVSAKEADTTAVCFTVLSRSGQTPDPHLLYQYEEEDHFRCYAFERNPSISANAHMLDALHYCAPAQRAPRVDKVVRFLTTWRQPGGFWYDKWHTSPYYTTSQVILAAWDVAPALVEPAIAWLLTTQHQGGSWGYYAPTLEETAYAVLALAVWRRAGHQTPAGALERGVHYLQEGFMHNQRAYPPLWITKVLYAPAQVIEATILAALLAYERLAETPRTQRDQLVATMQDHMTFETGFASGAGASG